MNQFELVESAKKAIHESEAKLAQRLEISPQALNTIKRGKKPMPDHIVIALAEIAGMDPAFALASINADKADKRTKEVWEEVARRTARVAALLIAVTIGISGIAPEKAIADQELKSEKGHSVYYVKSDR